MSRRACLAVVVPLLAALIFLGAAPAAVADPVIAAAGDIACDPLDTDFNSGQGSTKDCRQLPVSDLLWADPLTKTTPNVDAILPLGDNQYYCGGAGSWAASYGASWGQPPLKAISYPVPGNHEYLTAGGSSQSTGCDSTNAGAAGYFSYFGTSFGTSGNPAKGYYSYDLGAWHIIALNSSCTAAGGCVATSPQGQWLRQELVAHANACTLAYWHIPLFSSGGRASSTYKTFWDALYQYNADVVLNGHDHTYERFAPQTPTAVRDDARGLRQWVVGSGGANHTSFTTTAANSLLRNSTVFGILKLTLHASSYDWQFVPEQRDAGLFADSGTGFCHGAEPDTSAPTAPTGLTATAVGGNRIDLSWGASTDNVGVTEYRIFRDGSSTPVGIATTTSFSDTTVQPNTTYSYLVQAYDGAGNASGPSNTATATAPAPTGAIGSTPAAVQDRDCSDFGSQAEAQDFYEQAGPGDPHGLDADDDGRACDSNPCPCRGPGGGPAPSPAPALKRAQTIRSKVIRVIDGDTIVVRPLETANRPRYTVRLLGIDSPERSPKECGAKLATDNARRLAPRGRRVLLKTDPTQATFNRYNRLLAYVRLPNGRQLNKAQIAGGWAKVYVLGKRFRQYGAFKRQARRAKRQARGAWGSCGGMHVPA